MSVTPYQLPLRMRLRAIRKPVNEYRARLITWTETERIEAERIERERREAERLQEWNRYYAAKTLAEKRAYQLLIEHLTDDQKRCLDVEHYIEVVSQRKRIYRINYGDSMNVFLMDKTGKRLRARLCAGPEGEVPIYDTMFAQLILLKCDEDHFLSVANRVNEY